AAQRVELRHDAEDRIADAFGLLAQLRQIDLLELAVAADLVGRLLWNEAETALHLRQGCLDVEVLLRAVLVGPDVAHLVAGEDALEDGGVDDGSGHGGSFERSVCVQSPARCSVRCACSTTGRSIIRPSSRAAPGDAASAASTRRAHSTDSALGARAAWMGAIWRGWMHSLAPKPCRRDHARSASSRCSSSSWGVTPATGAARPATRDAMVIVPAACTRASALSVMSRSRSSA